MKSEFLTELDVSRVAGYENGRSLWQLRKPLDYTSEVADQTFRVPEDFITDFASVPRLPLVYWLMADVGHQAAVVHDYLYRTGALTRKLCDQVFAEALGVLGASGWRVRLMYMAVRVGGGASWQGKVKSEV